MHSVSSLVIGLLATVSGVTAITECGTAPASNAFKTFSEQVRNLSQRNQVNKEHISIKTYVHVIGSDDTVEGGYIGDNIVEREMDILNEAFAEHDISFSLKGIDRVVNKSWASPDGSPVEPSTEPEMRDALRKGGYGDLNLFFTPGLVPGGRCELPFPEPTGEDVLNDGCLVRAANDDPSDPRYGKVIIHEVGHWLGLEHTFENGCEEPGDGVDDTSAEAYPVGGDKCPEVGRDTCPDLPGLDPVDNYMTYVKEYV